MKRKVMVLYALVLIIAMFVNFEPPRGAEAQMPAGLHVSGVSLVNSAGERFIVSGVNMEAYRDYVGGCGWVSDGTYAIRGVMADRVKTMGINVVRLNYSYRFLATGGNLNKYIEIAIELAQRGIYVMPADHTYTGAALTNSGGGYPTKLAIIEAMRARGLEQWIIEGGFNEPGPDVSIAAWTAAYKNLLTYLRNTAQFKGVVVVDGTGWSTLLDVNAFKAVQTIDAGLMGGTANVVFSNHLYPNIQALPAQIWTAARQVPLLIGEIGPENPGASPYDIQYVKNVVNGFFSTGMPAGHNGIMFWILGFCDSNKMMEDWENPAVPYSATSKLNAYGQLAVDSYYSKVPNVAISTPVIPPSTVIVGNPTATRTPTRNTAIPTNTRTATRTATPVVSLTPSATATNTPTPRPEQWRIEGTIGDMRIDLTITRQ